MISTPCEYIAQEVNNLPHAEAERRQRELDWPALCRYESSNAGVHGIDIVYYGDSITEGWQKEHQAYFSKKVIDRGISGQTSAQMLARFYADVIALHPRIVHIIAGSNDIAGNTGPTSPEAYKNNMRAMVDLATTHGIRVIVGAIPPADRFWWAPALRPSMQIRELNTWLKSFAHERGLAFIDYHAAMTTPEGGMRPELSNDGVHPNAAGYALMESVAAARLRQ